MEYFQILLCFVVAIGFMYCPNKVARVNKVLYRACKMHIKVSLELSRDNGILHPSYVHTLQRDFIALYYQLEDSFNSIDERPDTSEILMELEMKLMVISNILFELSFLTGDMKTSIMLRDNRLEIIRNLWGSVSPLKTYRLNYATLD